MNEDLDKKAEKSILTEAGFGTVTTKADRMETYLIVIEKTRTGYSAHCPDVLGCGAVGKTVDDVLANM